MSANKTKRKKKLVTYLPIFDSSSISDGARLFRRHNVAIIPMCNVRQHTKSMISKSKSTAPTATAIMDADVTGLAGTTRSRPTKMWPENSNEKRRRFHFDRFFFVFPLLLFHLRMVQLGACIEYYLFRVCILNECLPNIYNVFLFG